MTTTTVHLPEFDEWSGTPQWHEHLCHHGMQQVPDGPPPTRMVHITDEGCPGCAVGPMMTAIRECWTEGLGVIVEDLWSYSDGYGSEGYIPEQGYDWSGIRDSSPAAIARMFKVATANGFHGATR